MSVYRTSNNNWTYDFQYGKRRIRRRFKTREEATRAEAEKRTEVCKRFQIDERLTFSEAATLFFEKHSKPNKRSWKDDER